MSEFCQLESYEFEDKVVRGGKASKRPPIDSQRSDGKL